MHTHSPPDRALSSQLCSGRISFIGLWPMSPLVGASCREGSCSTRLTPGWTLGAAQRDAHRGKTPGSGGTQRGAPRVRGHTSHSLRLSLTNRASGPACGTHACAQVHTHMPLPAGVYRTGWEEVWSRSPQGAAQGPPQPHPGPKGGCGEEAACHSAPRSSALETALLSHPV